jgi:hypothetical protein
VYEGLFTVVPVRCVYVFVSVCLLTISNIVIFVSISTSIRTMLQLPSKQASPCERTLVARVRRGPVFRGRRRFADVQDITQVPGRPVPSPPCFVIASLL